MEWREYVRKTNDIHNRFIHRAITRMNATYELEQLEIDSKRIAQLLRCWEDERTLNAFTQIRNRSN